VVDASVPFVVRSNEEADPEFLALPPDVQEIFIAAFRELAATDDPLCSGSGWYVEELRQKQRIAPEGVFSVHVHELWRGAFYRKGSTLIFIGFGFRIPEFYDKLSRLRNAIAGSG
jgi:hypothetical protein